jgi:hypothetical protein
MKNFLILMIFVFISFFSFSEGREAKKDLASDQEKIEMKKVFLSFLSELKSFHGDFSIIVKGKKIEKLWTSGDSVSYAMVIGIADQTEKRSIICNRAPKFWLGYQIEKYEGFVKDRYKNDYIKNSTELISLLEPIRVELELLRKSRGLDQKEEVLVSTK